MKVGLLGATGVAGRALIPRLLALGHELRVSVRTESARGAHGQASMESRVCDILSAPSVADFTAGLDALVNVATSIPKPGGSGDWSVNDRIRREGTAHVLSACADHGVRLVQQSVAMLHCVDDSRLQTEDDPVEGYGMLVSAAELEHRVMTSKIDWCLVRGAAFYGPGTGREELQAASLADPSFRIPGDGLHWITLVHVEDFASGVCAVLESAPQQQAYIVADDQPLRWQELFAGLARARGLPAPPSGGPPGLRTFRVSNAKLRALGWHPAHPVFTPPAAES